VDNDLCQFQPQPAHHVAGFRAEMVDVLWQQARRGPRFGSRCPAINRRRRNCVRCGYSMATSEGRRSARSASTAHASRVRFRRTVTLHRSRLLTALRRRWRTVRFA
jgi:hypothetical protein